MKDPVVIIAVIWLVGAIVIGIIDRLTSDTEPKDGATILWPIGLFILLPLYLLLRRKP